MGRLRCNLCPVSCVLLLVSCYLCLVTCVLLPVYDLVRSIQLYDAHDNKEALGYYDVSRGDQIIEVEDN